MAETGAGGNGGPGLGARVLAAVRTRAGRRSLRRTLWAYWLARLHLGRRGASSAMAWACRPRPGSAADPDAAWGWAHRLIRPGRLPGTCLTRSIVLARVLSVGDGSPAIRLGVRKEADGVRAHAWVEIGGRRYGAHPAFEPLGEDDRALPRLHDPHP